MYLKMVWCYVFLLTLLDISLNTKLTAQGKSHGTVHDQWMLIEKVHFQEYGKDSPPMPPDSLRLSPPALEFGRAALARPAAVTVTVTNTANTTLHLASVAGTTPHFHASFFDSKTLAPQANTTFTVVYLGRREGLVSAHLYIHTSLGVHKYPVSAEGVASEFEVWPIIGVRAPLNATLEPLLTMRNPTDQTIQVTEVYSSSPWLGLQLPDGGQRGPRALWTLPPHSTVGLVRLRIAASPALTSLRGYIRIKANITGGSLVVGVEAVTTAQQEYLDPLQLPLRVRGSGDPPQTWDISAGTSGPGGPIHARAHDVRCARHAFSVTPPGDVRETNGAHAHGVTSEGVTVTLLRQHFDDYQPLVPTARLTLDFGKLWDSFASSTQGSVTSAWCAGWAGVGRALLPYSVRIVPGSLVAEADELLFITANVEEVMRPQEVRVRNDYKMAVRLLGLDFDPQLQEYFKIEESPSSRSTLAPGQTVTVCAVTLLRRPPDDAHATGNVRVRSEMATVDVKVHLASGRFQLEWEWPGSSDGTLRLGTLSTSSTRRVALRLRNPSSAPLCVRALRALLPGAGLTLAPGHNAKRCVGAGESALAWLAVVAPARAGPLSGSVRVRSQHAESASDVTLSARSGHVRALDILNYLQAAPFAPASVPIHLISSMAARMRVTHVTVPDPAVYVTLDPVEVTSGTQIVGTLHYAPDRLCAPNCYTGLDLDTEEGALWASRLLPLSVSERRLALEGDLEMLERRLSAASEILHTVSNVTLYVHTTEVVQIPLSASIVSIWPRLWTGTEARALCGVGGTRALRLPVKNPSSRPLVLHPRTHDVEWRKQMEGWEDKPKCVECSWAPEVFKLRSWHVVKGSARPWGDQSQPVEESGLPPLLMEPDAEIEIIVDFTPRTAAPLAAKIYLRNNLTVLESIQVWGFGVLPSVELGGRRPARQPISFEIAECGEGGLGQVRRSVRARNTGLVPVTLGGWSVAGAHCQARGFKLWPCAPMTLAPNESRDITIAFQTDWTLAKVPAVLQVWTDTGPMEWPLTGLVPARLLGSCGRGARGAGGGWAGAGRGAALLALALVLAAAALDAERELRRASAARPQMPVTRSPLDLRGVPPPAHEEPPPPAAPRRKRARRAPPPPDARAERRAFERWRAEMLRREDSHSSEGADAEGEAEDGPAPPAPPLAPLAPPRSPPTPDDDVCDVSTGSDTSSPCEERDDPEPEEAGGEAPAAEGAGPALATPPAERAPPRTRSPPHKPERKQDDVTRNRAPPRNHVRKEKPPRRRAPGPRAPHSPPARAVPAPVSALRRGATWSSVVAEGGAAVTAAPAAPLAPIGSDVRRRDRAASSLFYFNDASPAWTPSPACSLYREDNSLGATNNMNGTSAGYGTIGSVWGAGAPLSPRAPPAWLWGAQDPVRPPPGFGDPPRAPPAPRAYDPFRSLASIWGPGALAWRRDPSPPH